MPDRYACFISYRHARSRAFDERIADIEEALRGQLAGLVTEDLYRDPKLNPGEQYNATFAEVMCHSYCLIVIYTSTYKESEYCRGEFQAMRDLQSERFRKLGANGDKKLGMIIPIVLHKIEDEQLPPEMLTGSVQHADLSRFYLLPRKLSRITEVKEQLNKIANHIAKVRRMVIDAGIDLWSDCQVFEIPRGVQPWGGAAASGSGTQPPFPFRPDKA